MPKNPCPLCHRPDPDNYLQNKLRSFLQCRGCGFIFVPRQFHLSAQQEKAEYDLHENSNDDPGYRNFLRRMVPEVTSRVSSGATGLDFGCGPCPVLAQLFQEQHFNMKVFDKFYFADPAVFRMKFDFITATEVFEHLADPAAQISRLWNILKSNGVLAVMTKRAADKARFANWHYIRDLTHIGFFSEQSLNYLADTLNSELLLPQNDIALFIKK